MAAYSSNNASQSKQMTPQEAQTVKSKEGQETGRRRLGRGHSNQTEGGQYVQEEPSEKRGRLSGRDKDKALDVQSSAQPEQKLKRRRGLDN